MNEFRLLVSGSRSWVRRTVSHDGLTIATVLNEAATDAARAGCPGLIIVHGACLDGADKVADGWALERRRLGWPVRPERHPADWRRHDKRAGFVRNKAMVALGADRCVAFIDVCRKRSPACVAAGPHGSHGATHCADKAEQAGIPTVRYVTAALYEALAAVAAPVSDLSTRRDAANH
ncbi:SLOG family protein [Micromonospora tulbaghiae]|uniref:SLOG family protein n=1 Tax=Micromonospora tulbaghiae TaxID=479978 RepID=UPI0033DAD457